MSDAITDELAGINLGQKTLNEPSLKVMQALAAIPQVSINAACGESPGGADAAPLAKTSHG